MREPNRELFFESDAFPGDVPEVLLPGDPAAVNPEGFPPNLIEIPPEIAQALDFAAGLAATADVRFRRTLDDEVDPEDRTRLARVHDLRMALVEAGFSADISALLGSDVSLRQLARAVGMGWIRRGEIDRDVLRRIRGTRSRDVDDKITSTCVLASALGNLGTRGCDYRLMAQARGAVSSAAEMTGRASLEDEFVEGCLRDLGIAAVEIGRLDLAGLVLLTADIPDRVDILLAILAFDSRMHSAGGSRLDPSELLDRAAGLVENINWGERGYTFDASRIHDALRIREAALQANENEVARRMDKVIRTYVEREDASSSVLFDLVVLPRPIPDVSREGLLERLCDSSADDLTALISLEGYAGHMALSGRPELYSIVLARMRERYEAEYGREVGEKELEKAEMAEVMAVAQGAEVLLAEPSEFERIIAAARVYIDRLERNFHLVGNRALARIAEYAVRAGRTDWALDTVTDLTDQDGAMLSQESRDYFLRELVTAACDSGRIRDAWTIICRMEDEIMRAQCLCRLAGAIYDRVRPAYGVRDPYWWPGR